MTITNKALLGAIFTLKSNFRKGRVPDRKMFDGIEVTAFKNNAKAAVCISADFELNWAWRGRNPEENRVQSRHDEER